MATYLARAWCMTLLALAAVSLVLADRLPGEYYNEYHFAYETPCTQWAKPLAGGSVKAFFIAPTHAAREVTELAQRLDLEVGGETAISSDALGDESRHVSMIDGTSNEEKKEAILAKLRSRHWDVFVLANLPIVKLPAEVQFEILKRVSEGAGLLLTYRREAFEAMWRHPWPEASEVVAEVPVAGLTFYRDTYFENTKLRSFNDVARNLVQGYRMGIGRVALIDYAIESKVDRAGGFCLTPHEPFTHRTTAEYDYHQSLVAKALLWAARREPSVRFQNFPATGVDLTSDAAPTLSVAVRNQSAASIRGMLSVRVRNPWGEIEHERAVERVFDPGAQTVQLALPRLAGGTHFLDLIFTSLRGVEGWASAALVVTSPLSIAAVELDDTSFLPAETCTGMVRLDRAADDYGYELRLTLLDNYGRRYFQDRIAVPMDVKERPFRIPLARSVSLAGRLRAELLLKGLTVHQTEREFFVRQPLHEKFPALVWGNLPGIFGHFAARQLHTAGFNGILHYYGSGTGEGRRPAAIAREDFHAVPHVTQINWENGRLGAIEKDEQAAQALRERTTMSKPFAPMAYSLGDANVIPPEGGFHQNEREAFHAFLSKRYEHFAYLNDAWGTTYTSFAEAEPITREDAAAQRAFVRFHDTESFREQLYAQWHYDCRRIIREVDPAALVGAEASVPGDMELTIQGLELWGAYRRVDQNTLLRSLAPRQLLRGNWFGGYTSQRSFVPGLPRFMWESVLDGSTLLQLYGAYTCENVYNTDLSWAPWMASFLPDLREITNGLGQLLTRCEHDCDPVAVYHSQRSVHIERLSAPFGAYEDAHRRVLRVIEGLSYAPVYVTSRQVERGALRANSRPRVLILPHIVALSDKEVTELVAFVEAGGVLIADVRPGVADGQCRPRRVGALDGMFGVTRTAGAELGQAALRDMSVGGSFRCPAMFASIQLHNVRELRVDSSVRIDECVPLGRQADVPVPLGAARAYGQGAAVLLNFSFSDVPETSAGAGDREALFELVRRCIEGAAPPPKWRVTHVDKTPLRGMRVAPFIWGESRVLGLLPPQPDEDVTALLKTLVKAPARAHLYDIREGRYLGFLEEIRPDLSFASATFIAALPVRVSPPVITVPARLEQGRTCTVRVTLRAVGATIGRVPPTILRLNVTGPDGVERLYYARTMQASAGAAQTTIPFAFNDPPGTWTLTVRDMLTGAKATARVDLEGPK